jgi:hypothetical protein
LFQITRLPDEVVDDVPAGLLAAVLDAFEDFAAALLIKSDEDVRAYQDEWHHAETRHADPLVDAAEQDSVAKTALDLELTDVKLRVLTASAPKESVGTLTVLTPFGPKEVNRRFAMLSSSGLYSDPEQQSDDKKRTHG